MDLRCVSLSQFDYALRQLNPIVGINIYGLEKVSHNSFRGLAEGVVKLASEFVTAS